MYKINGTGVLRISDMAAIPNCPGNRDWDAYVIWRNAGNTPLPEGV